MTDPKSSESDDGIGMHVEFPYPKLVHLFDFYFPKTKGYKKFDWRKILRIWSKWAPWVALLELILMVCFFARTESETIQIMSCLFFILSFVNIVYYLVLAAIAKFLKRSPQVLLALTPKMSSWLLIILTVFQLGAWIPSKPNDDLKKEARQEFKGGKP